MVSVAEPSDLKEYKGEIKEKIKRGEHKPETKKQEKRLLKLCAPLLKKEVLREDLEEYQKISNKY